MTGWQNWDAAMWQAWAVENWSVVLLAVAGLVLLLALMARATRPARGPAHRRGEFISALPDRHVGPGVDRGQLLPDRRADILAAIDNDYATGRIDRVEWERRRNSL